MKRFGRYFSGLLIIFVSPILIVILCVDKERIPHASFKSSVKSVSFEARSSQSYYSLFSSEAFGEYLFTIPEFEQHNLVCIDSCQQSFRFEQESKRFKQVDDGAFFLNFISDNYEMASKMGRFTDDLDTHDCLFVCSIQRVLQMRPFSANYDGNIGFFDRIRLTAMVIKENINNYCSYYLKPRSETLGKVEIKNKETTRFGYLFFSNISGHSYLLEDLPLQEKNWDLYYYPSLVIDSLNEDYKFLTVSSH